MSTASMERWQVYPESAAEDLWSPSSTLAFARARTGSDLFCMPGVRVIDDVSMLATAARGDFTLSANVEVEGSAFGDAAGILLRAGDHWVKACLERTKQGAWHVVTVASYPYSDEAYGARVRSPRCELLVTRQGTRIGVLWRPEASLPWRFVRTLRWPVVGEVRVGLFSQAPFSQGVQAAFRDVTWSTTATPDRR